MNARCEVSRGVTTAHEPLPIYSTRPTMLRARMLRAYWSCFYHLCFCRSPKYVQSNLTAVKVTRKTLAIEKLSCLPCHVSRQSINLNDKIIVLSVHHVHMWPIRIALCCVSHLACLRRPPRMSLAYLEIEYLSSWVKKCCRNMRNWRTGT